MFTGVVAMVVVGVVVWVVVFRGPIVVVVTLASPLVHAVYPLGH